MDLATARPDGDRLGALRTPCLVLDEARMARNLARLRERLQRLDVPLRPHLKTVKSVELVSRLFDLAETPVTVSTLREAEIFAAAGARDILYAVGITPAKLPQVAVLLGQGVELSVVLDSVEQAQAVADFGTAHGLRIPVLIELDVDLHRSGVSPHDAALIVQIARILESGGAVARGVLAHAGESYVAAGVAELEAAAEAERMLATVAAGHLRAAGFAAPVVSVGSTPTAHFARDGAGISEVRAGVFLLFDLVMAGIGVCAIDDIALSVLATVIGHQRERGLILVDAGWMAMSRDRGTATQTVDQGYGIVCDLAGTPYPDLLMVRANQEHGTLQLRPGSAAALPDLPVGTRVRILPNHACATGAQHDCYHVVSGDSDVVHAVWPRFRGW